MTPRPADPRRLARLALLTAVALTIFLIEVQLPVLPIPGAKLGLANIVTVYAVMALGPGDALLILLSRVFLGAVFSGQMSAFFYSLGGGLLCWAAMCGLKGIFTPKQIWLLSPISAMFHNVGQLLVAAGMLRSWAVFAWLPYLLLAGAAAGLFTGLAAQFLLERLNRIK